MSQEDIQTYAAGDTWLIQGILENNFQILEQIYLEHLPAVSALVKNNNGTPEDARDVFQEAIVVVFKNASEPGFKLTTTLGGYLYSICRFIWLRQLKKKHRTEVTLENDDRYIADENVEAYLHESEKRQLFRQKLMDMGADCRQVLQLFFEGVPLAEIGNRLGYTEDYIKKKNKNCKDKLADMVKKDPRYQELK